MAAQHLGERLARLRRARDLTQEALAERSGVSVDVVRKLEQQRKHSARLPTLHSLATGLGVELTALLGEPPAVATNGDEPLGLTALRRALLPSPIGGAAKPIEDSGPTLDVVRAEITEGWTLYHDADFARLIEVLPGIITETRMATAVYTGEPRAAAHTALGKALQLGGHLAIRLGKTDLALAALDRATQAAEASDNPLLAPMIANSISWAYQRQNRLDDARELAISAADAVEPTGRDSQSPDAIQVWGGLLLSAGTTAARSGDYSQAKDVMAVADAAAQRLGRHRENKLVSVFNRTAVRIEQVRLAVGFHRPEEAVSIAQSIRLSKSVPPTWRTWLYLDIARAKTDLGDGAGAVKALQYIRAEAPSWMRHHTLAVSIVTDLRHRPGPQPPGLRALADFLGVE